MKYKVLFLSFFFCAATFAQKISNYSPDIQLENQGRGFVAYRSAKTVLFSTICLSWRFLKTDNITTIFNLYKAPVVDGVMSSPVLLGAVSNSTFYKYSEASNSMIRYFLHEVVDGVENSVPLAEYTLPAYDSAMGTADLNYIEIPIKQIPGDTSRKYSPNDASFADLDGDGEMEIVIHLTGAAQDNANGGITDPPVFQAYKLDGTFLWEIYLGVNIREGAHYTQFMLYDLNGDGEAELVCKTAEGGKDSKGKNIGEAYFPVYKAKYGFTTNYNANANYRNGSGYILTGPEFLTVFNGETGEEIVTTEYDPPRYSTVYNNGNEVPVLNPSTSDINSRWGDNYGNRVDRFLACVAYLDGIHPSVVMCRGYYTRTVLVAYDFDGINLTKRWKFDTYNSATPYSSYAGQGNHNLSVGDVDGDGFDEIVYGSCTIDHDGKGLYNSRLGHGDAMHLTDFIPERPGLEIFKCHESGGVGTTLHDAATGEVLWQVKVDASTDVGRCMGTDIHPGYRGMEMWSSRSGGIINAPFAADAATLSKATISTSTGSVSMNMACWWDGDLSRELQDGTNITKYNTNGSYTTLLSPISVSSNNGTKANPCIIGDILGD